MERAGVKVHDIGVIMNGVTGRMGTNQHLMRSIAAIRNDGGIRLSDGTAVVPRPLLVGRNAAKLEALAAGAGGLPWTTDLDAALADPAYTVYFDAQTTDRRAAAVRRAITAGKHVYCEKPTAATAAEALDLYARATRAGVRHGVVQDKLWLPGIVALKRLCAEGFFGKVLSVRGEFGYWVFEGDTTPAQRPSWNYRAEEGGGIIADMFAHWRYVLDELFGRVTAVSCLGSTHIARRWDEQGQPYACTADDAAYAMFEIEGGIVAQFNSSWCVRVRRDDLLTIQVDGTKGSAVAGLRNCWVQPAAATPRPIWNPDVATPGDYRADWQLLPEAPSGGNAFRLQWELFLRHVAGDGPFPWDLLAGARGVQLAELAVDSWRTRRWVSVPPIVP
jgi:predicted dehydrogenase